MPARQNEDMMQEVLKGRSGETQPAAGSETLTAADEALIDAARQLITARYTENRHHIAAAVRGASGRIYTGLHLDTYVGRASVCAEAVALGQALTAGETAIEAIVSLRHPRPREQHRDCKVVSPCGICREMLTDFAAGCVVILAAPEPGGESRLKRVPVADLLPEKYRRQP
ncbi:MAG: cytidine deaminase [Rhodospirillaceae bacterium]|nr:MAG: cytidine deaminase [Rhodospirillaceae bacterium]